ncbi:MAG: hypothetical protein NTV31_04950 [Bacteroidia bacterium]|nr:hypothetical protein [Bacteroidia bacterium]
MRVTKESIRQRMLKPSRFIVDSYMPEKLRNCTTVFCMYSLAQYLDPDTDLPTKPYHANAVIFGAPPEEMELTNRINIVQYYIAVNQLRGKLPPVVDIRQYFVGACAAAKNYKKETIIILDAIAEMPPAKDSINRLGIYIAHWRFKHLKDVNYTIKEMKPIKRSSVKNLISDFIELEKQLTYIMDSPQVKNPGKIIVDSYFHAYAFNVHVLTALEWILKRDLTNNPELFSACMSKLQECRGQIRGAAQT